MDAVFIRRVVCRSFVIRTAIVPDHNVTLQPLMMILGTALDHMVRKLINEPIAFVMLEPFNAQNFSGIEVQCLAASL